MKREENHRLYSEAQRRVQNFRGHPTAPHRIKDCKCQPSQSRNLIQCQSQSHSQAHLNNKGGKLANTIKIFKKMSFFLTDADRHHKVT